ncbi:hypothetical protein Taro_049126 [Colocasia esculenta]|uniref:Uncharacterized protein n=1 Tax=Colocasia esculenta TaxID=4460 RepID=A0A843XA17_COLES|nr:hypothetical protein [Colocasia esculenta]
MLFLENWVFRQILPQTASTVALSAVALAAVALVATALVTAALAAAALVAVALATAAPQKVAAPLNVQWVEQETYLYHVGTPTVAKGPSSARPLQIEDQTSHQLVGLAFVELTSSLAASSSSPSNHLHFCWSPPESLVGSQWVEERHDVLLQGGVPFSCEGRPGVVSRVVFPSVVKEDLVGYPRWCFSLHVKEDQLRLGVRVLKGDSTLGSEILRYCSGTGCRTPVKRSPEPG